MVKVGFIDSGIGGLSVIKELHKMKYALKAYYIYDNKYHPYGNRTREELAAITFNNVERLNAMGVDIIALACNTATSAAIDGLRATFSIPIIGTEPPIKPALKDCDSIAVLATRYTRGSERFMRLVRNTKKRVYTPECDELAEMIERRQGDRGAVKSYLTHLFARIPVTDGIVLGCTHYYYAQDIISELCPFGRIYSASGGVARRIAAVGKLEKGDIDLTLIPTGEKLEEDKIKKFLV